MKKKTYTSPTADTYEFQSEAFLSNISNDKSDNVDESYKSQKGSYDNIWKYMDD